MTTKTLIVREPVGVNCSNKTPRVVDSIPAPPGGGECRGVLARITLSRLEEGLLHEGYQCTDCHRRVKYVPKEGR